MSAPRNKKTQSETCPVVGLPRPFADYEPYGARTPLFPHLKLPVSWISWHNIQCGRKGGPKRANWLGFDSEAMKVIHEHNYNICGVCGLALGNYKVFARLYGNAGVTTGTGMHAACALLSYHYCPDLLSRGHKTSADDIFEIVYSEDHGLDFSDTPFDDEEGCEEFYDLSEVATADATSLTMVALMELARRERTTGDATSEAAVSSCPFADKTENTQR
jgi:hypothetical protein